MSVFLEAEEKTLDGIASEVGSGELVQLVDLGMVSISRCRNAVTGDFLIVTAANGRCAILR